MLSLTAFRIKPPMIAMGMEIARETGSKEAPRTPPKSVQITAAAIILPPLYVKIGPKRMKLIT